MTCHAKATGQRRLHNPITLSGVGGLAVVRGVAYLATGTHVMPLGGYPAALDVPHLSLVLVGAAWLFVGALLWVSMVYRRLFIFATSLMAGTYATWVALHTYDTLTSPDWNSIIGLSVYALMIPVTITLASIEVAHPAGEPCTVKANGGDAYG